MHFEKYQSSYSFPFQVIHSQIFTTPSTCIIQNMKGHYQFWFKFQNHRCLERQTWKIVCPPYIICTRSSPIFQTKKKDKNLQDKISIWIMSPKWKIKKYFNIQLMRQILFQQANRSTIFNQIFTQTCTFQNWSSNFEFEFHSTSRKLFDEFKAFFL